MKSGTEGIEVGVDDATAGLHSDTAAFLTTEDYLEDYRSTARTADRPHRIHAAPTDDRGQKSL